MTAAGFGAAMLAAAAAPSLATEGAMLLLVGAGSGAPPRTTPVTRVDDAPVTTVRSAG
jgi:hypothetical protein